MNDQEENKSYRMFSVCVFSTIALIAILCTITAIVKPKVPATVEWFDGVVITGIQNGISAHLSYQLGVRGDGVVIWKLYKGSAFTNSTELGFIEK